MVEFSSIRAQGVFFPYFDKALKNSCLALFWNMTGSSSNSTKVKMSFISLEMVRGTEVGSNSGALMISLMSKNLVIAYLCWFKMSSEGTEARVVKSSSDWETMSLKNSETMRAFDWVSSSITWMSVLLGI